MRLEKNNKSWKINAYDDLSSIKLNTAINNIGIDKKPIICCIGSDLVLGDSLGPIVGTMLKERKVNAFIYGTLQSPITAKEIEILKEYLEKTHINNEVISVDAGIGDKKDVGYIRVMPNGIKPGLGLKKNLSMIGTKSIVGIVAEKTEDNYKLFNDTRLSLVYKMATIITEALTEYIGSIEQKAI